MAANYVASRHHSGTTNVNDWNLHPSTSYLTVCSLSFPIFSWAVSGDFTFGEWLIGSCQHILVQEYARLLNTWCQWNNCSRHFIAGVSLLENGEPHKAFDLFMQSAKGVLTEPFLAQAIVHQQTCTENEAMTQYYLKVIQLFEQHSALDHVIALAKTAIGILEPNDPQLVSEVEVDA